VRDWSPALALNLQVMNRTTPGAALRERADIVRHFHIFGPLQGGGYEGWSRGEYIDFINALEEVNYPGEYFTIEESPELDPNETAPKTLRYFRQLLR
jgi:hypothetical protein